MDLLETVGLMEGMGWDEVVSVDHTTVVLGELSSLNHLASVGVV
jgi:hypothetical protein